MGMEVRRRSLEEPYAAWRSEVDRLLDLLDKPGTPRPDFGAIRKAIRDMDLAMRDYMWSVRRVRAGDLLHTTPGERDHGFRPAGPR
ncbi:hypothetical protein [Piscinibacter koreensis]|uniref:Uncharacterized protein n=1 Tax=Piscinibacter koreensis TaxID=2742824 RepID=A0A7Y6NS83_9BURK|nr:hypothetical protein [Schlegelella koreensis]NUZ08349.1 hypothetical protein [Schlegelella koreensis]